jgi:lipoprotein
MKNKLKIISILLATFLLTGCTVVRIDTNNIDTIVNVVLSKNNRLYNKIGKGYKYYKPRGVSSIDTNELNDVLYSDGNYYYLYIDAVSYYYQSEITYKENKDAYYSKKIDGDKKGYIEIQKQDNKYHIEFVYNYAKIEALVEKDDINKVILDASYILSTVKFNDNIIALMLNDDYFTNKEEQYDKFKVEEETDRFLQYNDESEGK